MSNPPTKKRKRLPRKPPTTEVGRQILAEARAAQAEEEALLGEKMTKEALRRLQTESHIRQTYNADGAAFGRSVVRRVAGVLASEGLTPRLDIAPTGGRFTAWTDFVRIFIRYTQHQDVRLQSATLRGLMYHEGGHLRWTDPWLNLLDAVKAVDPTALDGMTGVELQTLQRAWNGLEDQRMETAVVSDSPRKAAYFTPMIMTELMPTPEAAVANWPLFIWRRYLPKHLRSAARDLFVAQNGESLASAMEKTVDLYVKATDAMTMWWAIKCFAMQLADARITPNLPSSAAHHDKQGRRQETEEEREERMSIPIDQKMEEDADPSEGDDPSEGAQGEGESEEDEGAAAGGAGKPSEEGEGDEDGAGGSGEGEGEEAGEGEGHGAADAEGEGEGQGDGAGEGDAEGEDDTEGGESEAETQGGGGKGASKGAHGDDRHKDNGLDQKALDEARQAAEEERNADPALDGDVEAFHDAKENAVSQINPYNPQPLDNAEAAIVAEALAEDIARSFHAATMDRVPMWVEGERSGIVNVGRFVVSQESRTGDLDFFRRWTEEDLPGHNIAVSVLLDYSGSMDQALVQLAQVGYACKLACKGLNIPCTVTLWDEEAQTLWDASEDAEFLPEIDDNGGTNPAYVLADLDNQRHDKEQHLVIIMTDGGWQDWHDRTMAAYDAPGRVILGVGYDRNQEVADGYAALMKGYGMVDAIGVTDLMEIPLHMEHLLISMA